MAQIVRAIEHIASQPDRFVIANPGHSPSSPLQVPSPYGVTVDGRPGSNLMQELRWYLESFLDYPFPPETGHAANVMNALNAWGMDALETFLQSDRTLKG